LKKDPSKMLETAKHLKPYGFWIFMSILCSLGDVILKLLIPYIMKGLMDTATDKNFALFSYYLYISVGLIILGMIIAYLGKYSTKRYNLSFIRDMKNHITEHVQRMPIYISKNYSSGDIISRVNNDLSIISNFYNNIPVIIFQPVLMIIALIYMFLISWKLTLATIILIPITSIIFDKINSPIQAYSKDLMEQSSILNTLFKDSIGGIYVLKAFNLQETLTKRFRVVAENIKSKNLKIAKTNAYLTPVFLALRLIPQLIYPLYGGFLTLNKEMSLGSLFAFGTLIGYVFGPVESILSFRGQIRETKPAINRISELLHEPLEPNDGITIEKNNGLDSMEFDGVAFSYDGDASSKEKTLNNISLNITKGNMTALVGPSGSGKSTILKLICGFYKPTSGSIKLFDKDITEYKIEDFRSQISYMSQESYLYPSTIAENIAIGNSDATMDEIITAAKTANAHDFITKLSKGYDTFVGEKGNFLSGGECQRIALARMILKNSPIILMDEPTSSLDPKAEALIQDALSKLIKNKTVLVVAHRLSTIKEAHQIIVLEKGFIKECGNHEDLMERDGLYKILYNNQFSPIQEEGSAC
jgi:ABC-type multidrug transport system fused ATPase/permease subunit